MRLAGFIDPDLVIVPIESDTKSAAVDLLLDQILQKHPFLDRRAIEDAINERESVENTSMGRGFAFPHARSEGVDRMYVAMGISHSGIPADTPDGGPLHVVVLLLTPRNIAKLYLQTLSAFMSLCRNSGLRRSLVEARTADDVLRIIWESGVKVQNDLLARDIMRRPVVSVRPDTTLKQVANLLYKHRISGMPVVDEQGMLVGEISERELLLAALPDFEERVKSEILDSSSEPFEDLLKQENDITVRQLMTIPQVIVSEDKTVVELAAIMLQNNIRRVIVASGGELTGLIMRSDIVSRVIRG